MGRAEEDDTGDGVDDRPMSQELLAGNAQGLFDDYTTQAMADKYDGLCGGLKKGRESYVSESQTSGQGPRCAPTHHVGV